MKLGTDILHASRHCCRGFHSQRSKVKVMFRPNKHWLRHTDRRCDCDVGPTCLNCPQPFAVASLQIH